MKVFEGIISDLPVHFTAVELSRIVTAAAAKNSWYYIFDFNFIQRFYFGGPIGI